MSVHLVDRRLQLGAEAAALLTEHCLLFQYCGCSSGKRLAAAAVSEPWEVPVGVWTAPFLQTSETFQDCLP